MCNRRPLAYVSVALLLSCFFATSCAQPRENLNASALTPTTSATTYPTSESSTVAPVTPDFVFVPFYYTVEDGDPGWKVGTLDLAEMNVTDHLSNAAIDILNPMITVETLEGKSYPAQFDGGCIRPSNYGAYGIDGSRGNYVPEFSDVPESSDRHNWMIRLGPWDLPQELPPKLPISMVEEQIGEQRSYPKCSKYIVFRFASAAHPTKVVMKTSTQQFTIDLQLSTIHDPTPPRTGDLQAELFSALADRLNKSNPKLTFEFGQCRWAREFNGYFLSYVVTNSDQLDDQSILAHYGIWFPSGVFTLKRRTNNPDFPVFKVGPGQTITDEFYLGDDYVGGPPTYFVLYEANGTKATLYQLDCPPKGT